MTDTLEKLTERTLGGLRVEGVRQLIPYFNGIFYGFSGVGKTLLAGSAAAVEALSPVLFIDLEGGTLTLREKYPQVDVVRVKTWKEMQNVYDELYESMPYKTVVMDSLTETQKFGMYLIMLDVVRDDPDRDPDIPGLRDWGKNIEQTRKLVRAFRDLPCNTIFTALNAEEKDKKSGLTLNRPSLSGKLKDEVAAFVDVVGYLYMKEVDEEQKHLMLFQQTDTTIAKDRSNKLPIVMEEPSMQKIYDIMFNTQETSTNA